MFFYAIYNPRMWMARKIVIDMKSTKYASHSDWITYVGYHTYAKFII